jgi:plastocyanin
MKNRIQLRPVHLFGAALVAFAVVASCGGDNDNGSPTAPPVPAPGSVVTVEILDFRFEPRSVTIQPGQIVRWVLRGPTTTHNVVDNSGAFDSGFVFTAQGAMFERAFPSGENGRTFEYRCTTHVGCCQMQGSVRVGSSAPAPGPGY